jgi:hypothetical protein
MEPKIVLLKSILMKNHPLNDIHQTFTPTISHSPPKIMKSMLMIKDYNPEVSKTFGNLFLKIDNNGNWLEITIILLIFYTWFIIKLYSSLIRFVWKGCVEEV